MPDEPTLREALEEAFDQLTEEPQAEAPVEEQPEQAIESAAPQGEEAEAEEISEEEAETEEGDEEDDGIDPPVGWSTSEKETFYSLPTEVKKRIVDQERTKRSQIEQQERQAQEQRAMLENLLQQQQQLQYMQNQAQSPSGTNGQVDPVQARLAAIENAIVAYQEQERQKAFSQSLNAVTQFCNEQDEKGSFVRPLLALDETGQLRHPLGQVARDAMKQELAAVRAAYPNESASTCLEWAYQNVIHRNPILRQEMESSKKAKEAVKAAQEQKKKAAKAKLAGTSVGSTVSSVTKPKKPQSLREELEAAWEQAERR